MPVSVQSSDAFLHDMSVAIVAFWGEIICVAFAAVWLAVVLMISLASEAGGAESTVEMVFVPGLL
jgi:hypothetical protein